MVFRIVVQCVDGDANNTSSRKMDSVDVDTALKDLAWEKRGDRWAEAHGFIDAGAEKTELGEVGSGYDILYSRESRAYKGGQFGEMLWVVEEVVECRGEGCGGRVGSLSGH